MLDSSFVRQLSSNQIPNAGSGLFTQKRYNNTNRVFDTGEKNCDYQGLLLAKSVFHGISVRNIRIDLIKA